VTEWAGIPSKSCSASTRTASTATTTAGSARWRMHLSGADLARWLRNRSAYVPGITTDSDIRPHLAVHDQSERSGVTAGQRPNDLDLIGAPSRRPQQDSNLRTRLRRRLAVSLVSCVNGYLTTHMDHAWTTKPSLRSPGLPAPPRQAGLLPTRSPDKCTAQPRPYGTPTAAPWPARSPHGICTCTGKAWDARRSRSHSRTSRDDHSPRVSRSCRPWIATASLGHPRKRDDQPCLPACLLPSAIVHGGVCRHAANVPESGPLARQCRALALSSSGDRLLRRSFRPSTLPSTAQVEASDAGQAVPVNNRSDVPVLARLWHDCGGSLCVHIGPDRRGRTLSSSA
jgi:hypothetical protein